jgi:hypothetical protein
MGGGVDYRLTGGHVRNEMCLLISMFLGYEYIIPIITGLIYRLRIIYA